MSTRRFEPNEITSPIRGTYNPLNLGKALDDFESYSALDNLNGLNAGTSWAGSYEDRDGNLGLKALDDMETYTSSSAVNGLNDGTGWSGSYVDR